MLHAHTVYIKGVGVCACTHTRTPTHPHPPPPMSKFTMCNVTCTYCVYQGCRCVCMHARTHARPPTPTHPPTCTRAHSIPQTSVFHHHVKSSQTSSSPLLSELMAYTSLAASSTCLSGNRRCFCGATFWLVLSPPGVSNSAENRQIFFMTASM